MGAGRDLRPRSHIMIMLREVLHELRPPECTLNKEYGAVLTVEAQVKHLQQCRKETVVSIGLGLGLGTRWHTKECIQACIGWQSTNLCVEL